MPTGGNRALRVDVPGVGARAGVEASLEAAAALRVRTWLHADGLGTAAPVRVVDAGLAWLELEDGRLRAATAEGASAWLDAASGVRWVELSWRASLDAADEGYACARDVVAQTESCVAVTLGGEVEEVRLGIVDAVGAGTSGTVYFDDVELRTP